MVLVVASACLRSIYAVELAAIAVVVCSAVLAPAVPIPRVNVYAEEPVLVTAIFVTIVVVDDGTVYSTVVVVVVAAPRNSALDVVAINYYFLFFT
jgi:hypothetical protein